MGTENIYVVLHNISATTCQLGGILPLYGIRADGTAAAMHFVRSSDPAIADPGAVTGAGPVAPGEYGAFHITVGLNCAPPAGTFARLRIVLAAGQYVEMPYPVELTLGCPGAEAQAGPIGSLAAPADNQ